MNEANTIGRVAGEVRNYLSTVLVVDDGSMDDTSVRAQASGAQVIRNTTPQGKGAALQEGWRVARRLGFDWVLCLDGDGQHAAADIPAFFACAERTGAALVVGNRMADPGGMPWLRRQVNRWMSRQLSRLAGQVLPDTQNGFRLIHLAHWTPQFTGAAHFEIESEMLLDCVRQGLRVEFVPVTVIYESERSKIRPWRDTVRWFRWWRGAVRQVRPSRRRA